jgi:uncharacterized protein
MGLRATAPVRRPPPVHSPEIFAFPLIRYLLMTHDPQPTLGRPKDGQPTGDPSLTTAPEHIPTPGLYGHITHTELVSGDPSATKAWCAKVLGWTFMPSMQTPGGEYHLFAFGTEGGGGIRTVAPSESPGSIPYVHVRDTRAAFEQAIHAGAEEMLSPTAIMEGVTIALVRAPGGVAVGFSGP